MKQLVQDLNSGESRVIEAPAPAVAPNQVLIEVAASVVSPGTERSVVGFGQKHLLGKALSRPDLVRQVLAKVARDGPLDTLAAVRQQIKEPIGLGYAVSGVVRAVGEGVTEFTAGDRVAAAGGGYAMHAEVVAVPVNLVVSIPDDVDYEAAAFTTLGAIALQGVRLANVTLGSSVGVIGLGVVGLLTVQELKAAGCRVFGIDPKRERASLAGELGADGVATASDEFLSLTRADTRGRGLDAVLITADTSSNEPVLIAAQAARDRATVVVVGAVGLGLERKPYFEKELEFRVSRSYGPGRYDADYEEKGQDYPIGYVRWTERRNMEAVVALIADGKVEPARLITHRIAIDEGARAYALITDQSEEPSLGVVLTYPGFGSNQAALNRRVDLVAEPVAAPGPIAIALLGAGKFAKGMLLPIIKNGSATCVAVCSATGKSARVAADQFGFRYCSTDWRATVADPQVNTVVITTRHHLHAEQTAAALRAGKHVFVEKPLCLNAAELETVSSTYRELANAASAPLLMVGFNRRFAPMAVAMRAFAAAAAEPLAIHYRINGGRIPLDHWTQDPAQGGGRLVGEMVHFVDWVIWMAGDQPTHVHAAAAANGGIYNDDNVAVTIRFHHGSIAQILYLANGGRAMGKERIEVHGGGRSAFVDDFNLLEMADGSKRRRMRARLKRDKGHRAAWAQFAAAVESGGRSPIAYADIETTMRATFGALQSVRERREIALDTDSARIREAT